jgi:hypothetical protein
LISRNIEKGRILKQRLKAKEEIQGDLLQICIIQSKTPSIAEIPKANNEYKKLSYRSREVRGGGHVEIAGGRPRTPAYTAGPPFGHSEALKMP